MHAMLLGLYILLSIGDAWTTLVALRLPGTYEASLIGRFLIGDGKSLTLMIALKTFAMLVFAYAVFGVVNPAWTPIARLATEVFRWLVVALLFDGAIFVVASNLRTIRRG